MNDEAAVIILRNSETLVLEICHTQTLRASYEPRSFGHTAPVTNFVLRDVYTLGHGPPPAVPSPPPPPCYAGHLGEYRAMMYVCCKRMRNAILLFNDLIGRIGCCWRAADRSPPTLLSASTTGPRVRATIRRSKRKCTSSPPPLRLFV
eukprot:1195683-Prorocentrum_minimum.AAC.3